MLNSKKGFTLIEFIIVMAIIGILVLLAAPKFMDYIRDAKLTQIKNDTRVVEDVLLTEQAKLLTEDKDIDQYLIKDVIKNKGISKDNKELANIDQGEGIQIDPEIIKNHTNTKLNLEGFYFNKDNNKVFYHDNKVKEDIKEDTTKEEKEYRLRPLYYFTKNDEPKDEHLLLEDYGLFINGWGTANDKVKGLEGDTIDIRDFNIISFNTKMDQDENNFIKKINKDTGKELLFHLELKTPFEIQGDTIIITTEKKEEFGIIYVDENTFKNKVNEIFNLNINRVIVEN